MNSKFINLLISLSLLQVIDRIEGAVKGSIDLDAFTFEKVVSKFKVSLVRIDTKYPTGEKQDEFTKFVNNLKPNSDLLIAEVGVEDFSPFKNQDLADKFAVKKTDFPSLKLFINGDTDKPISYGADIQFLDILNFIKKNTDIFIHLNQTIEEFDKIVVKFIAKGLTTDKQKKLLNEAKKKSKSLTEENDKKSAQIYVKLMEKVIERGIKFIESEEQRVLNIMSGKITPNKRDELQGRINIIQSFKV